MLVLSLLDASAWWTMVPAGAVVLVVLVLSSLEASAWWTIVAAAVVQ
jgi:hypothetical protein